MLNLNFELVRQIVLEISALALHSLGWALVGSLCLVEDGC